MKEAALHLFEQYPNIALLIGFLLAVFVALIGLIPSPFITAANVLFFGYWPGVLLTFLGETVGAAIAFVLYRRGFKTKLAEKLKKYHAAQRLLTADNKKAFWLIFSFRLIPVLPSGLVTFASAMSRATLPTFVAAGSLGKLPSMLLEGYAALQVTELTWEGKVIIAVVGVVFLYFVVRQLFFRRGKKD